jgi:hypothetical protein
MACPYKLSRDFRGGAGWHSAARWPQPNTSCRAGARLGQAVPPWREAAVHEVAKTFARREEDGF